MSFIGERAHGAHGHDAAPPGGSEAGARLARGPSRVVLVIAALGDGGAERVVCLLAKHWSREGRHVTVVTVSSRATDTHELPLGVGRVALDLLRPSRNVVEGLLRSAQRALALRRALSELRPDAVVSFTGHVNVLTLVAALRAGIPVFVSERTDPRRERLGGHWVALRRLLYPRAAGVIVQTESVAEWARAFCPHLHVIPNFVERPPGFANPGASDGPKLLLAMGRLSPEKGFDLLIEAFARVADRHPDWSLTILGEGAARRALEAQVERLGLRRRVHLPGRSSDTDARLAEAHAFALPSRYEGFPNALLEAMACGLPAVAFDCRSGPSDIIAAGRDGVLVPEGDVARFAGALDRLMGDPSERSRMGLNAREIAEVLSPERVLRRWSVVMSGAGE